MMKRRTVIISMVMVLFNSIFFAMARAQEQDDDAFEQTDDVITQPRTPVVTTPSATPTPTAPDTTTVNSDVIPVTIPANEAAVDVETTNETVTPVQTVDVVTTPQISTEFPIPWISARAFGIASYILLCLLSITGMLLTMGVLYRIMSPAAAWSMHRAIGSVLLFSVLGHIGALLFDHFINLRPVDVLIPFLSPYQPTPMALGIIGFYLMLLILTTTLYTMTSHAKFWRTVHFFAFPMFILIFIHNIMIGTDAQTWWMRTITWGGLGLILLTVVFRFVWKYRLAPRR